MNVVIRKGKRKGVQDLERKAVKIDRYRSGKAPSNEEANSQEEEDFVEKIIVDPIISPIPAKDRRLERLARFSSSKKPQEIITLTNQSNNFDDDVDDEKQNQITQSNEIEKIQSLKESESLLNFSVGNELNQCQSVKCECKEIVQSKGGGESNAIGQEVFDECSFSQEQKPQSIPQSSIFFNSDSEETEANPKDKIPIFLPKANRQKREIESEKEVDSNCIFENFQSLKPSLQDSSSSFKPDFSMIDDSDPQDEAGKEQEFHLWKMRQLARNQRDSNQNLELVSQKAQVEAFRALSPQEKEKILKERMIQEQQLHAENKTKYKFLQKYYHKGAFFQDDTSEILQRDYNVATASEQFDKSMLPQSMQVRGFGKKGRSKWTHLTEEDTTAFDAGWGDKKLSTGYKMMQKMGGMRGGEEKDSSSLEKRKK